MAKSGFIAGQMLMIKLFKLLPGLGKAAHTEFGGEHVHLYPEKKRSTLALLIMDTISKLRVKTNVFTEW